MNAVWQLFDGRKNYIAAAALVVIGLVEWAFPVVHVQILGMSSPESFISGGIAWMLGRNALAKVGIQNKPVDPAKLND